VLVILIVQETSHITFEFNFSVINVGDSLLSDSLNKTCSGGTGGGLTPSESQALLDIQEAIILLPIILAMLGIMIIGEWKNNFLFRLLGATMLIIVSTVSWTTSDWYWVAVVGILVGIGLLFRTVILANKKI